MKGLPECLSKEARAIWDARIAKGESTADLFTLYMSGFTEGLELGHKTWFPKSPDHPNFTKGTVQ